MPICILHCRLRRSCSNPGQSPGEKVPNSTWGEGGKLEGILKKPVGVKPSSLVPLGLLLVVNRLHLGALASLMSTMYALVMSID